MRLCYDFEKWTIISLASIAISLTVGLILMQYAHAVTEEERQANREKYAKMIQEDIEKHDNETKAKSGFPDRISNYDGDRRLQYFYCEVDYLKQLGASGVDPNTQEAMDQAMLACTKQFNLEDSITLKYENPVK